MLLIAYLHLQESSDSSIWLLPALVFGLALLVAISTSTYLKNDFPVPYHFTAHHGVFIVSLLLLWLCVSSLILFCIPPFPSSFQQELPGAGLQRAYLPYQLLQLLANGLVMAYVPSLYSFLPISVAFGVLLVSYGNGLRIMYHKMIWMGWCSIHCSVLQLIIMSYCLVYT